MYTHAPAKHRRRPAGPASGLRGWQVCWVCGALLRGCCAQRLRVRMRLLGRRQDRRSRQPTQMAGLGETADGAEGGVGKAGTGETGETDQRGNTYTRYTRLGKSSCRSIDHR